MRARPTQFPILLAAVALAGAFLGAPPVEAQQAQLKMSAGPYYSDVPIEVQVVLEGFDEEPRPQVVPAENVDGAQFELVGLNPSVSTFVRISNGRRTQSRTVTWTAQFQLLVERPGPFRVPALEVSQGAKKARIEGRALIATAVPQSSDIGIALTLPERPVYPGQRVPIKITMTLVERLTKALGGYTIRSPLFDREGDFDFVDPEFRRGAQPLNILAGGEQKQLLAVVERVQVEGRPMVAVIAERTLVPLRPGTIELVPATIVVEEVTRWSSGFFPSDRRAAETRLLLAKDLPRRLVVKELPTTGRPPSFAGAVGRGFSLTLEADRTVVQVGDPITLTLTLSGDGNLENAGLPYLIDAGLPEGAFQVPEASSPGIHQDGTKVFRVTVRVRDEGVNEIPPLEYAWFDPDAEAFRTVTTAPVALSVRRGETVGADAVIGLAKGTGTSGGGTALVPQPTMGRPRFTLIGADLAIETAPARLAISERDRLGGEPLRLAIYALSGLLVFGAIGLRVRDRIPPEVRERRVRLAAAARAVESAARDLASTEALASVTAELRAMLREVKRAGGNSIGGLDLFLAECEDRIYARRAGDTGTQELAERARGYAQKLFEMGR